MSIFDLLFIALFLASVATLWTAAVQAIRGKGGLRILRRWAICAGVYMAIVCAVALAKPQKLLKIGDLRCFDDWCIAVAGVEHAVAENNDSLCNVRLQISSQAKRVTQRANGAYVYLTDADGRRFDPLPDAAETPLDVMLTPGQMVEARRVFKLPADARDVGLVVVHGGSYCFPGCFIIGDEANPLGKRTVVRLP
ncbi:MAG TPA: hypothetical protein VMT15_05885 [Bryobacteraceae bacterium]|nr:hypothetical protein [Bryobacteraceae bacterium]